MPKALWTCAGGVCSWVILLVCGFPYYCTYFGAHLKMMKADRMLDSKHSISGNETREEFSRLKGYIMLLPTEHIQAFTPWQQNWNHKSLVGTYPLDLPETIVTLLPSCAHLTTKMTSPPADAKTVIGTPSTSRSKSSRQLIESVTSENVMRNLKEPSLTYAAWSSGSKLNRTHWWMKTSFWTKGIRNSAAGLLLGTLDTKTVWNDTWQVSQDYPGIKNASV